MKPLRALLAAFFSLAGVLHFTQPKFYEAIVPPSLASRKREIVAISGAAEIAGGAMVLHPATRNLGRWWLLSLLLAVFPANVHMATNPEDVKGLDLRKLPRWTLWARLPLQPLMMLWVWRVTRTDRAIRAHRKIPFAGILGLQFRTSSCRIDSRRA